MAEISEIVSVSISLEDARTAQQGFDTILFIGDSSNSDLTASEVREYTALEELTDDGFLTTDAEYLFATAVFSQDVSPESIKITKELTRVAQQHTIDFDADFVTSNNVDLDIDGVAVTTTPFNTDHTTTLSDLASNIQSHASVSACTVTGARQVTVTAQTAGVPITISDIAVTGGASQAVGTSAVSVANVGIQEDLTAIVENDNDWYGLVLQETDQEFVELAAAWVETKRKLFATRSTDTGLYDSGSTTDVAYVLQQADYDRTMVIHAEDADEYIDGAILARCLAENAGSVTFKFKELSGITTTTLTTTQRNALDDKNANYYHTIASQGFFREGKVASGEFADIVIGADWITARIEENVFTKLINAGKVAYTDQGIQLIEGEIRGVLLQAIDRAILAEYSEDEWENAVSVPLASEVSSANKAARLLEDVTFSGTLAGAIHKVTLSGQLSV